MNKLFGVVDKNDREQIQVSAREYQGHPYVDVRVYWRTDPSEEWKPSRKGVTVRPDLVGELIALLQKANGE